MKKKSWDSILAGLAFLLILPCVCCMLLPGQLPGGHNFYVTGEGYDMEVMCDAGVRVLPLEEYLLGTLAAYTTMESEPQMLKALVVLLRSNAVASVEEGEPCELTYYDYWTRAALWGEREKEYTELGRRLITETVHEIMMTEEGDVVTVPFFKVSAGKTRNGSVINKTYEYLSPVECMQDIESSEYMTVIRIAQKKIGKKLMIISSDEVGYVLQLEVEGIIYGGEEFRTKWDLPSACFTVEQSRNEYIFAVKGVGHGYGMSCYGADKMAKEGNNYREILNYYFPKLKCYVYEFSDMN